MKTLCLGCMEQYEGEGTFCPHCGYDQKSKAKEAYHISPGVVIHNRYLIGKVLGSGGFGITYLAYDKILQKKAAVKEYLPTEFATRMPDQTRISVYAGEKQEQFEAGMKKSLEEAKRLAEFQQTPGVTQIYDFFEENNTAYIVMELLVGETLKQKLKRDGVMSVEQALPIILAVLGALKAVHAKNIIHRDIAPDNIFLLNTGEVKLLDFGASRQVTTTHSKSLTVILKLGYAPVEQYQSGGNQGPWTDVYALAATFYKMITGKRPQESPERRINDTLKSPSKMGVVIDKNIENALMNALQVRIEDRTKSAAEFEQALYSQSVTRTVATVEKNDLGKWPFWLKGACAVAAVVVVGTGVFAFTRQVSAPRTEQGITLEEGMVRMPAFINLPQEMAQQRAQEAGLELVISDTETSDTVLKDYVLRQKDENGETLSPGTHIEEGSTVYITLSSGNGKAMIPSLLYMNADVAKQHLKDLELNAINIETVLDYWGPEGSVIEVNPGEGNEVQQDAVITLKVAGNQEHSEGSAAIPDVTNMSEDLAYRRLKELELFLEKTTEEYSSDIEKGHVISQVPASGTAQKGDIIKVIVSAGPRMFVIPNFTNWTLADAQSHIESLGLQVGEIRREYSDLIPEGQVIAQSPASSMLKEGAVVVLTVSDGIRPTEATAPVRQQNSSNGSGGGRTSQLPQSQTPAAQPATEEAPTAQPATEAAPAGGSSSGFDDIF